MRAYAAVLAGIAALAFPSVAFADVMDGGAESPDGLGSAWSSSPAGWVTDAYGQPMTPAALDPAANGARLFVASADGATLMQTVPVAAEQVAQKSIRVSADLGAYGAGDARGELSIVGRDADGQIVAYSSVKRGPTPADRNTYGQVQRCSISVVSTEIRSLSIAIVARLSDPAERVFADNVALDFPLGQPAETVPASGGPQAGCTPIARYQQQAQAQLPAPLAPQTPAPVANNGALTPPPAPLVTLKGASKQRLGSLRFTVGSNRAGAVLVTARIGTIRITRSLRFLRPGLRDFKLRTSSAQNRRLRAALRRGTVAIRITASGNDATATKSFRLRK